MALNWRMRPKLSLDIQAGLQDLLNRLADKLGTDASLFEGSVTDHYVVIRIPETRRHVWSPQLQFEVTEQDKQHVHLSGMYMPAPSIWTLFAGLYGVILFAGFSGTIFGLAQWQLNHPPHALWSLPASLLMTILVYCTALLGQRMGQDQMKELEDFLLQVAGRDGCGTPSAP